MVKSANIIRRLGNKENDIKFFKHLLPLEVKTVVEPFGGTFAVIKHFYKDVNKYKFHINDNDEVLYYVYCNYKDIIAKYEEISKIYINEYVAEEMKHKFKSYFNTLDINENIKKYIDRNIFVRGNMFKPMKSFSNFNINEQTILDTSILTNLDYKNIFELYKDDPDTFMFLDPPYLFSDNSNYSSQLRETDMTQIIIDILEFLKVCKCKVMLIINKLNIINYLFKEYIRGEYLRVYQISKKQSYHLIITNY